MFADVCRICLSIDLVLASHSWIHGPEPLQFCVCYDVLVLILFVSENRMLVTGQLQSQ
jgi:hypothetical protein